MRITENSSIGTMGLTGIVILAGVIWGGLNPWWLVLSSFLILAGIGSEVSKSKD